MKKFLEINAAVLAVLVALVSCSDERPASPSIPAQREIGFDDERTTLKEELMFYEIAECYKLTEESVQNDLSSFLALRDRAENGQYAEGDGLLSARNAEEKYEIRKTMSFSRTIPGLSLSARGVDTIDDINFSVHEITNREDGTRITAVTSDDERVGSILCVIERTGNENEEDDPVLEIFLSSLDDYVVEVGNELETITENDIELFKEKYGITDEDIERARLEYENSREARKFW